MIMRSNLAKFIIIMFQTLMLYPSYISSNEDLRIVIGLDNDIPLHGVRIFTSINPDSIYYSNKGSFSIPKVNKSYYLFFQEEFSFPRIINTSEEMIDPVRIASKRYLGWNTRAVITISNPFKIKIDKFIIDNTEVLSFEENLLSFLYPSGINTVLIAAFSENSQAVVRNVQLAIKNDIYLGEFKIDKDSFKPIPTPHLATVNYYKVPQASGRPADPDRTTETNGQSGNTSTTEIRNNKTNDVTDQKGGSSSKVSPQDTVENIKNNQPAPPSTETRNNETSSNTNQQGGSTPKTPTKGTTETAITNTPLDNTSTVSIQKDEATVANTQQGDANSRISNQDAVKAAKTDGELDGAPSIADRNSEPTNIADVQGDESSRTSTLDAVGTAKAEVQPKSIASSEAQNSEANPKTSQQGDISAKIPTTDAVEIANINNLSDDLPSVADLNIDQTNKADQQGDISSKTSTQDATETAKTNAQPDNFSSVSVKNNEATAANALQIDTSSEIAARDNAEPTKTDRKPDSIASAETRNGEANSIDTQQGVTNSKTPTQDAIEIAKTDSQPDNYSSASFLDSGANTTTAQQRDPESQTSTREDVVTDKTDAQLDNFSSASINNNEVAANNAQLGDNKSTSPSQMDEKTSKIARQPNSTSSIEYRDSEANITTYQQGDTNSNTPSVEALSAALRDENESVRSTAAKVLAEKGGNPSVEALSAALRDGNEAVRYTAAKAIGEFSDDNTIRTLMERKDFSPKLYKKYHPSHQRPSLQMIKETMFYSWEGLVGASYSYSYQKMWTGLYNEAKHCLGPGLTYYYAISHWTLLSADISYATFKPKSNDQEQSEKKYSTTLIPITLSMRVSPFAWARLKPYVIYGIGVMGWQLYENGSPVYQTRFLAKSSIDYKFDLSLSMGIGFEFYINQSWSIDFYVRNHTFPTLTENNVGLVEDVNRCKGEIGLSFIYYYKQGLYSK